jgi:hypothetical protein
LPLKCYAANIAPLDRVQSFADESKVPELDINSSNINSYIFKVSFLGLVTITWIEDLPQFSCGVPSVPVVGKHRVAYRAEADPKTNQKILYLT